MSSSGADAPPPPPPPAAANGSAGGSAAVPSTPGSVSGDTPSRRAPLKKQRILWDSDAATRGGKTSIGVLLDWLTTPGNYTRWRAGKSQFGETREALCSEIKAEMRKHGILHRENANIRTQISELERAYDAAVTWLVQHGYNGKIPDAASVDTGDLPVGVDASAESSNPVEAYVLRTCRYFHAFDAIVHQPMGASLTSLTSLSSFSSASSSSSLLSAHSVTSSGSSPSKATALPRKAPRGTGPRALKKKEAIAVGEANEPQKQQQQQQQQQGDSEEGGGSPVVVIETMSNGAFPHDERNERASSPAINTLANRAAERRQPTAASKRKSLLSTSSSPLPRAGNSVSAPSNSFLTGAAVIASAAAAAAASESSASGQLESRQSTQATGSMFDVAHEERNRKRFKMDEEKSRLECEKLQYEVQTAKLRLQVERALARQQLTAAGLSLSEIEAALEC